MSIVVLGLMIDFTENRLKNVIMKNQINKYLILITFIFIGASTITYGQVFEKDQNTQRENVEKRTRTPVRVETKSEGSEAVFQESTIAKDQNEAQEAIDNAIKGIHTRGDEFVKVIKNRGSKEEMTQGQIKFQNAVEHAREVLSIISRDYDSGVNLAKAHQDIQNAIDSTNAKAAQAMQELK